MSTTICTLYEKEYHYGLGALINSLSLSGFQGNIWAGHRGSLTPFWFKPDQNLPSHPVYSPAPGIKVHLIQRNPPHHFTHDKANWCQEVLEIHQPEAEILFYFDPDIIVLREWRLLEEWTSSGIALCEDISNIPTTHPLRKTWLTYLPDEFKSSPQRDLPYFNAGFLGLRRKHFDLLQRWNLIQGCMLNHVQSKQSMKQKNFFDPLHLADQNALNLACQISSTPLCWTGSDGMGLQRGLPYLSHSVLTPKPWNTFYLKELLRFKVPNWNHLHYWKHCHAPIRLYSKFFLVWKRLDFQLSRILGLLLLGKPHRFW
jgi:hypothetical protein